MQKPLSQLAAGAAALLSFVQPTPAAIVAYDNAGADRRLDTTQIVLRARGGDSAAFAELYQRFAPHLMVAIQARMRRFGRIGVDAVDVAQETWRRALSRFPTFDPRQRSFLKWIVKVGNNIVSEYCRSHARRRCESLHDVDEKHVVVLPGHAAVSRDGSRVVEGLASNEQFRELMQRVGRLGKIEALIVAQHAVFERSHADIARALGWKTAAVCKRWQRTTKRLRRSSYWRRLFRDRLE